MGRGTPGIWTSRGPSSPTGVCVSANLGVNSTHHMSSLEPIEDRHIKGENAFHSDKLRKMWGEWQFNCHRGRNQREPCMQVRVRAVGQPTNVRIQGPIRAHRVQTMCLLPAKTKQQTKVPSAFFHSNFANANAQFQFTDNAFLVD